MTASRSLQCGRYVLDLTQPMVMGILNVTPDSFSDGGKFTDVSSALARAQQMIEAGAGIIDVGGESTRPGAADVSEEEEIRRVVPVIEAIAGRTSIAISIDTSKPAVMTAAVKAGACLINDVRALQEPGAVEAAARTDAAICLMHMQGQPRTMQHEPRYDDVVGEVTAFLEQRVEACVAAGKLKGDPRAIATMLWTVGHGTISLLITFPFYPFGDPQAYVKRMCDFMLASLSAQDIPPLTETPVNC